MGKLMGEQPLSMSSAWRKLARSKRDVPAQREGARIQRLRRRCAAGTGMYPHVAEIETQPSFRPLPRWRGQGLSASLELLYPSRQVRAYLRGACTCRLGHQPARYFIVLFRAIDAGAACCAQALNVRTRRSDGWPRVAVGPRIAATHNAVGNPVGFPLEWIVLGADRQFSLDCRGVAPDHLACHSISRASLQSERAIFSVQLAAAATICALLGIGSRNAIRRANLG